MGYEDLTEKANRFNPPPLNGGEPPLWHYSQGGRVKGPVSLTRLKSIIAAKLVNPHTDLVWTESMSDWQVIAEVEEFEVLLDRLEISYRPSPSSLRGPDQVKKQISVPELPRDQAIIEKEEARQQRLRYFESGLEGIGRLHYTAWAIVFPVLLLIAWRVLVLMQWLPQSFLPAGLALVGAMIFLAQIYAVRARLQHLEANLKWFWLHLLVPFAFLWTNFFLLACPGGYVSHRRLDNLGRFVAGGYVVLGLTGIGILVLLGFSSEARSLFDQMISPSLEAAVESAQWFISTLKQVIS